MKPGSIRRRRPSAAMVVATVAVVLAGGGVGYAATQLPHGSVGTAQLRNGAVRARKLANNAVGFRKIHPHAVGVKRVNAGQVQLRVRGACNGSGTAISAVLKNGQVNCAQTASAEFNTPGLKVAITSPTAGSLIASVPLPADSSYLAQAAPYIAVTGATGVTQQVTVSCEIADGTAYQVRDRTFQLTPSAETQIASIPLTVAIPAGSAATNVAAGCVRSYTGSGAAPVVDAQGTINALTTSSNTTTTTPVTTTPYSVP